MPLRYTLPRWLLLLLPLMIGVYVLARLAARLPPHVPLPAPPSPPILPLRGLTLVLDPGHGGEDPGAVRPYATEADLTYQAAAEIGQILSAHGATVLYTVRSRALDPGMPACLLPSPRDAVLVAGGLPIRTRRTPRQLWLRAAVARRVWAGRSGPEAAHRYFFLSLHLDDSSNPEVSGSLVCVDRRRRIPDFGIDLAHALVLDRLARPNSTAGGQAGLSARRLGVLNPDYNPIPQSALLELTTLSHFDDFLQANDPQWRAQMAARIGHAMQEVAQSH